MVLGIFILFAPWKKIRWEWVEEGLSGSWKERRLTWFLAPEASRFLHGIILFPLARSSVASQLDVGLETAQKMYSVGLDGDGCWHASCLSLLGSQLMTPVWMKVCVVGSSHQTLGFLMKNAFCFPQVNFSLDFSFSRADGLGTWMEILSAKSWGAFLSLAVGDSTKMTLVKSQVERTPNKKKRWTSGQFQTEPTPTHFILLTKWNQSLMSIHTPEQKIQQKHSRYGDFISILGFKHLQHKITMKITKWKEIKQMNAWCCLFPQPPNSVWLS